MVSMMVCMPSVMRTLLEESSKAERSERSEVRSRTLRAGWKPMQGRNKTNENSSMASMVLLITEVRNGKLLASDREVQVAWRGVEVWSGKE
jgi:hypothetical protein